MRGSLSRLMGGRLTRQTSLLRHAPEAREFPSPLKELLDCKPAQDPAREWARPRTLTWSEWTSFTQSSARPTRAVVSTLQREVALVRLLECLQVDGETFLQVAPDTLAEETKDPEAKHSDSLYGESLRKFRDGCPKWVKTVIRHVEACSNASGTFHSLTVLSSSNDPVVFNSLEECHHALSKFLYKLPHPVIRKEFSQLVLAIGDRDKKSDEDMLYHIQLLCTALPFRHRSLLLLLIKFWGNLCRMGAATPAALAKKVTGPLLGNRALRSASTVRVVQTMITLGEQQMAETPIGLAHDVSEYTSEFPAESEHKSEWDEISSTFQTRLRNMLAAQEIKDETSSL
eukprot:m.230903 g.230903  ORF g.230903 m.230903 type:complete len:343 (-) comp22418_c3_seq5:363-1391(-)